MLKPPPPPAPLELWGGVECTVNRVRDRFLDQLARNGHGGPRGEEDLERFAALGFRALRYPVLWERLAPESATVSDWSWPDRRLGRLRELGVRPIIGLIHHGSGPRRTNLLDPGFPESLADYARQVAERFPWVDEWTPVNEPLTTARFSGLYGHWYPHRRDPASFARALLHQLRGTVLAMRAVRAVNPGARLIQTEDLGKTFSTETLAYQAEFDNARRWLTFDLLGGRVDSSHPMWDYLHRAAGVPARELAWFRENPCPPDVLGLNYYVTSERFLDERRGRYPGQSRASNGRHAFVDVAAVRVLDSGISGAAGMLADAWERYRRPLAVTEVHLDSTREEQLRWTMEIWNAARDLRERGGADVRAVTLWSLLGSFNWNQLLKRDTGYYEPGVFDLRAPRPRPTALAALARSLAARGNFGHPVLAVPGWWRRPARLLYPPVAAFQPFSPARVKTSPSPAPLLITGAGGPLGRAFEVVCGWRGLPCRVLDRRALDPTDPAAVQRALDEWQPWAVVHAADLPRVDDAERAPGRCWRETVGASETLARACAEHPGGLPLLGFSSPLVFNGAAPVPYGEDAAPDPLNALGRALAEAERRVLATLPAAALLVRAGPLFSPWDDAHFISRALRALAAGEPFAAANDQTVSPTSVPDFAQACLNLLLDGERGVWHLPSAGKGVTWSAWAAAAAKLARVDASRLDPQPASRLGQLAPRPVNGALTSRRGWPLPSWRDALRRWVAERPPVPVLPPPDAAPGRLATTSGADERLGPV